MDLVAVVAADPHATPTEQWHLELTATTSGPMVALVVLVLSLLITLRSLLSFR